jgi:hypothetical protein
VVAEDVRVLRERYQRTGKEDNGAVECDFCEVYGLEGQLAQTLSSVDICLRSTSYTSTTKL